MNTDEAQIKISRPTATMRCRERLALVLKSVKSWQMTVDGPATRRLPAMADLAFLRRGEGIAC